MIGPKALLLVGVLIVIVIVVFGLTMGDGGTELSQTGPSPTSPSRRGAPAGDEPTVPPLTPEPDIQVTNHPLACRSTALAGQVLDGPYYPVLTDASPATRVEWLVDGVMLGSSSSSPFAPLDAAGVPAPIDTRTLRSGPHDVVALVHEDLTDTRRLYASFVTMGSSPSAPEAATIAVGGADGPATSLADWTVLQGPVTFSAATDTGEALVVEVDGRRVGRGPFDAEALAPGRHRVTAAIPAADGGPVVERTVVTTGGRPVPEPCAPVDVRSYGALVDGVTDDTDAVVAAVEVAMVSGATVSFPAGTHAVPNLKNVLLSRDVAFTGAEGAILEGTRPGEKYTMFNVDANVSFSGITVRNAGKLFSFDKVSRRIDRFTLERSSFADVYSPAHTAEPQPQPVGAVRITDNKVERAVKGFYLPLKLINYALVQDNVLDSVGDAAIRLGSDTDSSFSVQKNIDVRRNRISHVTGESDANGIKVMGVDSLIVDNEVSDIASADGTDSEGIYTKGHGHVIAGNHLHDAGRTQAQIAVKSDSTTVSRNTIVTEAAATNGIRIEGSNVIVKDNHLRGGQAESIGITTKLTAGFGGFVFEGNEIVDTDGIGISTGGDGPVIIRANQFRDLRGSSAVEVKATRADTVDVQIVQNVVEPMVNPGSRAFLLGARSGHGMTEVRILDNRITDAVTALAFDVEKDARVTDVLTAGNGWSALRGEALVGEERVDGFTNG